jgi:prepilin-type N-terminal cleavage/methylation domain-containing protein
MRRAGFTLIEIVVAIAVFGVLATTAYGVFARVLDAKQTVEARADEAALARTTLGRIVRDIRAVTLRSTARATTPAPGLGTSAPIVPSAASSTSAAGAASTATPGFVSIDHTEAQVPFDEIAFTAIVRRPLSLAATASDMAVVHYFLRPEERRLGRFILYRESVSMLSGETIDLAKPNPDWTAAIVGGVAGLRFRFFDGAEWIEEWSSIAGAKAGRVPLAVEMILALEGSDGVVETYRTAVDLPSAQATGATPQLTAGQAGGPGRGGKGKLGKRGEDDDDDEGPPSARRGGGTRKPAPVDEDDDEDDEDDYWDEDDE